MELVGHPAGELAARVRAGQTTARAVAEAHLDHLAAVEHRLGAFTSVRRPEALAEADAVDAHERRGELALAGVPIAVSDVIDVAGSPTRHGSAATAPGVASADAPVVAALRAAGAVVIGKTRVPELGAWGTSDDPEGVAVSPWDASRSAGGASGGAAAAVAAGVAALALGVDGLGSVRGPAAACGLVGVRPGAGHLAVGGVASPHWYGLSRYGVLATTVKDVRDALRVLDGDAASGQADPGALRVAVSWKAPSPGVAVTAPWREAALEAGRLLHHAGHEVTHRDPPYDRSVTQSVVARWTQGVGVELAALGLDADAVQPRTRAHIAAGERMSRLAHGDDDGAQRWQDRIGGLFAEVDVLVTPALARAQPQATGWHTRPWAANIAAHLSAYPYFGAWDLADAPALTIPLWHESGRPLSVQLVTPPGNEERLLGLAAQLEDLVPWARHAPGWGLGG